MKNSISVIKYAHFLSIFACALFVGTTDAYVYNISLLEKDGKKVVLLYDVHEDTPESTERDLTQLELIMQEAQGKSIHTHWFLEWHQNAFKYQEDARGMDVFFRNAFSGKYDNEYTTIENFDLRSLSFIYLMRIKCMTPEAKKAIKKVKSGWSWPTSKSRSFFNRHTLLEKAHTPEQYISDITERAQQIEAMLHELPQVSLDVKTVITQRYREAADRIIHTLIDRGTHNSLFDIYTNMTQFARNNFDFAALVEACLYTDIFMTTQILNILKESPKTVIFVYAGGLHCRDVALIMHSIGFQEHFKHPITPFDYTNFERDLDINLYSRQEKYYPVCDYVNYAINILKFISNSQYELGGTIRTVTAPAAPSHPYKAPTSAPQPSSLPVQQPAPGARVETAPRYYPTDPYKKAINDALRKSIK